MESSDYVPKGKRFYDNKAQNVAPAYLGNAYSGRAVQLGSDGYVDIPINAEAGQIKVFAHTDGARCWTVDSSGDWGIKDGSVVIIEWDYAVVGDLDIAPFVSQAWHGGGENCWSFWQASDGSGVFFYSIGDNDYNIEFPLDSNRIEFRKTAGHAIINGVDYGEIPDIANTTDYYHAFGCYPLSTNGGQSSSEGDVKLRYVRINEEEFMWGNNRGSQGTEVYMSSGTEITIPGVVYGQIVYFDHATKTHVAIAVPIDTYYRLENATFSSLVRLWDRSFTKEDRDMMDADHELLVRWALGEDVGFSIGTKDQNDLVWSCAETGAELIDIGDTTRLTINGTYSRLTSQSYGPQSIALELNDDGAPIGIAQMPIIHGGPEYIDTQWKPKLDAYTILIEAMFDGNPEQRVLIHDATNGDRYYVNGEVQSTVPTLPAVDKTIKLESVSFIGSGSITMIHALKIWTRALSDGEVFPQ